MTSKIVVNNIESDSGINTVTIIGDVSVGSSITATDITGTHHGSGADLTNLPAANLTGTVADARLTSVTASKLSGALPAISAANLTSIPAANITGTFGSVNASNLTNIPAGSLTGIVTAARLGGGSASSSTFLRGDGTFAEAGGGTIGAYVTHSTSTSYTFTSVTMQNGVHSATITPTKASSKILVLLATYCKNAAQPNHGVHAKTRINRGGTKLFESYHARSVYTNGYSGNRIENYGTMHPSHLIDTPTYNLGDSITYTVDVGYQGNTGGIDAVYWNNDVEKLSTFTLMELTT